MKVLDIIKIAMKHIVVLSEGEDPSAEGARDALTLLNGMLQVWTTDRLLVYTIESNVFSYVAGQASYTIGTGGDFNIPRPRAIVSVYNRSLTMGPTNVDIPVRFTEDYSEYASIPVKKTESSIPIKCYNDNNYPLASLFFWPVPLDSTYAPVVWSWAPLETFTSLTQDVIFPPGYEVAIHTNLALYLAPMFGKAPSKKLEELATNSFARIKTLNLPSAKISVNNYFPQRGVTGKYLADRGDFYAGA